MKLNINFQEDSKDISRYAEVWDAYRPLALLSRAAGGSPWRKSKEGSIEFKWTSLATLWTLVAITIHGYLCFFVWRWRIDEQDDGKKTMINGFKQFSKHAYVVTATLNYIWVFRSVSLLPSIFIKIQDALNECGGDSKQKILKRTKRFSKIAVGIYLSVAAMYCVSGLNHTIVSSWSRVKDGVGITSFIFHLLRHSLALIQMFDVCCGYTLIFIAFTVEGISTSLNHGIRDILLQQKAPKDAVKSPDLIQNLQKQFLTLTDIIMETNHVFGHIIPVQLVYICIELLMLFFSIFVKSFIWSSPFSELRFVIAQSIILTVYLWIMCYFGSRLSVSSSALLRSTIRAAVDTRYWKSTSHEEWMLLRDSIALDPLVLNVAYFGKVETALLPLTIGGVATYFIVMVQFLLQSKSPV